MKYVFQAKDGSRLNDTQANAYGQRIYELMRKNNKREVLPEEIVEDAKNKGTPYHDYFVWNNSKASRLYRLQQANYILRSIVRVKIIEETHEEVIVRTFHNVVVSESEQTGRVRAYVPEEVVFASKDYSQQVIDSALQEIMGWRRRYHIYQELAMICNAIEETVQRRQKMITVSH